MATVRFSESLREDIERNARVGFTKRVDKLVEEASAEFSKSELQEAIRDAMAIECSMTRAQYDQFPDGLLVPFHEMRLRSVNGVDLHRFHNRVSFSPSALKVPHKVSSSQSWTGYELHSVVLQDFADKMRDYNNSIDSVNGERDKFVEGVTKITSKCTTLKQALDIWPQLIDLVPDSVKQRHYAKSERKSGGPDLDDLGVDVAALNVGAVKNKLAQAI